MSSPVFKTDSDFPDFLSFGGGSVRSRDPLDAWAIICAGATRLIDRADLPSRTRQRLHNLRQEARHGAANRSAFGVLMEASPFASAGDALFWLELARAEIIGRSQYVLPSTSLAHESESHANHIADVAQITHRERRTRGTLEQLVDAMQVQAIASRVLADSEAKEMRVRSSIMLASR